MKTIGKSPLAGSAPASMATAPMVGAAGMLLLSAAVGFRGSKPQRVRAIVQYILLVPKSLYNIHKHRGLALVPGLTVCSRLYHRGTLGF